MIQFDNATGLKIAQALHLARELIYATMKDHHVYPSVGNMKFIDEAWGELRSVVSPELWAKINELRPE